MEFAFLQQAYDVSDTDVYTFANQALGAADADRQIIVCAHGRSSSETISITEITIGGVAATLVQNITNASATSAMCIANVPTGTTGDVVVTFADTMGRCIIEVYRAVGILLPATHSDYHSGTTINPTDTFDVSAGGVVRCGAVIWGGWQQTWNADAEWWQVMREVV